MLCNQTSDLKQPSEFIASCYIRMYVYMCVLGIFSKSK